MSERIKVDVVGVVVHTLRIDPARPEWAWLNDHPREDWPELLTDAANETDSVVEHALTSGTLDGAWRTAIVGDALINVSEASR
jgi:hypothetical protein